MFFSNIEKKETLVVSQRNLTNNLDSFKSKLELRRINKDRQNNFDRISLNERIASVKKLRSMSNANDHNLESFRNIIEKKILVRENSNTGTEGSRSIISKVTYLN